jgi:hypothetical protein
MLQIFEYQNSEQFLRAKSVLQSEPSYAWKESSFLSSKISDEIPLLGLPWKGRDIKTQIQRLFPNCLENLTQTAGRHEKLSTIGDDKGNLMHQTLIVYGSQKRKFGYSLGKRAKVI